MISSRDVSVGTNKVSSFHFRRGCRIDCATWKFETVARGVGARFVPSGEKSSLVEILSAVKGRTRAETEESRRGQKGAGDETDTVPTRHRDPSFYRDRDCFVISKKGHG